MAIIIKVQSDSYRDPLTHSISLRLVSSSGGCGHLLSGLSLGDDWTNTHRSRIGHGSAGHRHAGGSDGDSLNVAGGGNSGGSVVTHTSLSLDLLLETVHTVSQSVALGLDREASVASLLQVGVVSTN